MNVTQTIQFVELYRNAKCLWKVNSETYKDRNARDEALKQICNGMVINGFGTREVAQKIKNIRSAYYQELKKINFSKKSGASADDIYQPKVPWFTIVHSFLKRNFEMNATVSNLCNSQVESDNTSKRPKDNDSCVPDDRIEENSANEKESGERFKHSSMSLKTSSSKKKRLQDRCAPPSNNREANQSRIDEFDIIRKKLSLETEFDIWCQSLAKQLNDMDTLRALKLQMQIQGLVSEERIKYEMQKNHYSPGNRPSADTSACQLPLVWHANELQRTTNFKKTKNAYTGRHNNTRHKRPEDDR